jgi:hypothetical protein
LDSGVEVVEGLSIWGELEGLNFVKEEILVI